MRDLGDRMGEVLTTTKPDADELAAAGHARDRACNAPLQVGVGIKGGAEIAIATVRVALQRRPDWAVLSDDKTNGFNSISRESIFRGLRRWFPELIPTARLFYARQAALLYVGRDGRQLATDERDAAFYSAEGCTQGDSLGPFLFAIGYHSALLEAQAAHPDSTIIAYLDDTYHLDVPAAALACMRTAETCSLDLCTIASNRTKQEAFTEAGDLSMLPSTIRGAPSAPPCPGKGYAGGALPCIKVLGSYIGDTAACSARLVERVETHLRPLEDACRLRDTRRVNVSMQVQMEITRFCANTQLNYFIRAMPLEATHTARRVHDHLIERAFHRVVGTGLGTAGERARALTQARLPVKLGGLGLTSQEAIAPAAVVGTWALCWGQMQRLCPQLCADVDITTSQLPAFVELRAVHRELMAQHRIVQGIYDLWDAQIYDIDREGESHTRYHPAGLTPAKRLLPLAEFGSKSEFLQHAQRLYSFCTAVYRILQYSCTLYCTHAHTQYIQYTK